MRTFVRIVSSDKAKKNLFIKINGKILFSPWEQSRFFPGNKVKILIEGENYSIKYKDYQLPFEEKHWIVLKVLKCPTIN